MVHALLEHFKVADPSYICGYEDDLELPNNIKISTKLLNPLHLAVSYQQLDIVKYLVLIKKMSVKESGNEP